MEKLFTLLLLLSTFGFGQQVVNGSRAVPIPNASSTGTTAHKLAKVTGAGTAVIAATIDTSGIIGICSTGCGTTGNAAVTRFGIDSCVFDGATTANDYVQISSTTASDCHDTGATTYPTSGQVLGRVLSTNVSGGTYVMVLEGSEAQPGAGGSSGSKYGVSVKADFGAVGDGVADDTRAVQNAINSGAKRIYLQTGIYKITSTIHFGSTTTSVNTVYFYGDGAAENGQYTTRGSTLRWAGAANGTVMEVTSAHECVFRDFNIDGGGTASIGLLVDANNSGGGSNHQNVFTNIGISAVPGTLGVGLYISGNQFSVTNQDVCCSSYRNIQIYPGFARSSASTVKIGIMQDGIQTVANRFYDAILTGYTSRGVDVEAGDLVFSGGNFSGATSGSNIDDVYVGSGADWVDLHDNYHEITASSSPATRHAYNFPSGSRSWPSKLDGVRVLWGLSSGNPLYFAQRGPLTLIGTSWDSAPSGRSTLYIDNSGYPSAIVTLIGNNLSSFIDYFVTGSFAMPSAATDRSRRDYSEPFLCGRSDATNIGQYGWNLNNISGTSTASCHYSGWSLQGEAVATGGSTGNGGILILDGVNAHGIFAVDNGTSMVNGNATMDSMFRFQLASTSASDTRVGYMTPGTAAAVPTTGLYLRYATSLGDTTFWVCAPTATSETSKCWNTNVAADTSVHTFRIRNIMSGMMGVSLYTASGTLTPIGLAGAGGPFNEATICASGCNYTYTPSTGEVSPALSVITQTGATATGYLYEWRASLASLAQ